MNDQAFWTGYSWMIERINYCGIRESLAWMRSNCFDCDYDEGAFFALEVSNELV
jgi:hypothetical protein